MSSNVVKKSEMRELIVLPSDEENDVIQSKEPDWGAIAGVTGTPEGYPDEIIKLTPSQYRALAMLLQGFSQVEVANELGVSKRTVNRWMTSGSILFEIYHKRRWVLWRATNAKILNLYTKGVDELFGLLESSDERIVLDTVKFIVKKMQPNDLFNPDDPPEGYIEKYNKARNTSHSFFATPGRTVYRESKYKFDPPINDTPWSYPTEPEVVKYALDPEDYKYSRVLEYPEDELWDDDSPGIQEETHIKLSTDQIEEIVIELHANNVHTELFDGGVLVRNFTGMPVGLLFPPECNRESLFGLSYKFVGQYQDEVLSFFTEDRLFHRYPDRIHDYVYIPEVDDIGDVTKFLIFLAKAPRIIDKRHRSSSSGEESDSENEADRA